VRSPGEGGLSARVRALIAQETRRADILGAWILFLVAAFLGGLYLLSPKALDGMTELQPVPVAVLLFLLTGLVRLALAHAGRMSRAIDLSFVPLDFALLYGLIWSFHLQYHQPPAFYLKAPTFLFVFLLIAVRAVRLDPLPVVAAGIVAALGWAGMAAYALDHGQMGDVTRDFVTYMTSNAILVGAEVEKIIAILLVTLVLTLTLQRARRQLVAAATDRTAREDLSRFFDPRVASAIAAGAQIPAPGQGGRRQAAILVTDLRGFTAFAARESPENVLSLLIAYQGVVSAAIQAHGGAIDKFMGDGILATFGCTLPCDKPAADALRAAMAVCDASARFVAERKAAGLPVLPVGVALTRGDVLFGTVGDGERLEVTVIGEAVNRAVKLEGHNKILRSRLVVDMDCLVAAREQGAAAPPGLDAAPGQEVRGLGERIDLAFLREVA
jgi:adenylate cyclase